MTGSQILRKAIEKGKESTDPEIKQLYNLIAEMIRVIKRDGCSHCKEAFSVSDEDRMRNLYKAWEKNDENIKKYGPRKIPLEKASPRVQETVAMFQRGMSREEIAENLNISFQAVSKTLRRFGLLKKDKP